MIIPLTFLSVLWNANQFSQYKLAQVPKMLSLFPKQIIRDNLNDLMNDGVNRTIFIQFFGDFPVLSVVYNRFIDLITNPNYVIHTNLSMKISPYLNKNQDLYSISPKIQKWFLENKEEFISIKTIISNLGPHLCTAFNLDYDDLYHLYNYIFINEENDGVIIGKILDILDLPDDFISELSKILSFFDNEKPIIEMFDGLNSHDEYLNFIEKVRLLRIPASDERFFSFIKVIDAFSSLVDLISSIHHNFFVKNENEVIKPLMKEYLFNPIDIFDVSIFDRAIALNATLSTIQNYSSSCPVTNSDIKSIECKIYQAVHQLLSKIICHKDEDDDTCEEEVYERALNVVSDFTDPEVNLTYLLIVKYQIPENQVKFAFGLFENLTTENKTYVDLLQGLTLVVPENKTVSAFHYHDVKFHTLVTNITNLVNFIININDTSNFKLAFDYLNRTEQWNRLRYFVNAINQNKTVCEIKNLNGTQCSELFNSIIENAKKCISNETFYNSIPKESLKFVIDGIIPFLKSISSSVSTFASGYYNLTVIREGEVNYVDFTTFVKNIGFLFDKILSFVDDNVPLLYKKLPIIGDRYQRFVWKSHKVFNILKINGKTVSIFYTLLGRFAVVSEMLSSGASAYINESTTIETMTKSIKPKTFLNVYDTLLKISELKDLQVKNLAEAITYDSGSKSSFKLLGSDKDKEHQKVSFNDVFPIKTISENAGLLADEMNEDVLKLETISLALGIKKDKLKEKLTSFVRKIIATPAHTFKEVAIKSGNEKEDVDEYFEKISDFSQNVTSGKFVKLNSKVVLQKQKENKKRLSTPVIIGVTIAAVVAVSIIVAVTIYLVNKKKNMDNHDYISQQIMLVEN